MGMKLWGVELWGIKLKVMSVIITGAESESVPLLSTFLIYVI